MPTLELPYQLWAHLLTQLSLGWAGSLYKQQASHKDFAGAWGLCEISVSLENHLEAEATCFLSKVLV